jgi:hypothetical protein
MSSVNQSISRVRTLLLNPKDQKPTVDQIFDALLRESQDFHNELSNSHQAWTVGSVDVDVTGDQTDYLVARSVGKILFVTAFPDDNDSPMIPVEFSDLAGVSNDYWWYSPLDYGYARDFNERFYSAYPLKIAFYRSDGNLKFRIMPQSVNYARIRITYSLGDWAENLTTSSTAVLGEHHSLVETRAAINLLAGAEWTDNEEADERKRMRIERSLIGQEERKAKNFMYARRNLIADADSVRLGFGEGY